LGVDLKTIKMVLEKMIEDLQKANIENPRLNSELILSHILNLNKIDLYLQAKNKIKNTKKIEKYLQKRISEMPLQYILGETEFYGYKILVNKNVLIPRPETEFLIEKIVNENTEINSVLDIGTGSGAIAIALSQKMKNITATDISTSALKVAKKNAKINLAKIQFIQSDIFENIEDKFDIIVSNPPYISKDEFEILPNEIKKFEPEIALLAEENGLYFYKKILENAKKYLTDTGRIYFEIGCDQANRISEIAIKNGFSKIDVSKDLTVFDRIMKISN